MLLFALLLRNVFCVVVVGVVVIDVVVVVILYTEQNASEKIVKLKRFFFSPSKRLEGNSHGSCYGNSKCHGAGVWQ